MHRLSSILRLPLLRGWDSSSILHFGCYVRGFLLRDKYLAANMNFFLVTYEYERYCLQYFVNLLLTPLRLFVEIQIFGRNINYSMKHNTGKFEGSCTHINTVLVGQSYPSRVNLRLLRLVCERNSTIGNS